MDITNRKQILILIGGILIALLFYPVVTHCLFYYSRSTLTTDELHYPIIILEAIALYFYSLKVERQDFLTWPEKQGKALFYVLAVVILYILDFAGGFISNIPQKLGWQEWWLKPLSKHYIHLEIAWYNLNPAILIICYVSWSICIELIFRGYLLPRLAIVFKNNVAAVVLSSLLFALFPFFYFTYHWMICDFISGIVFSIFYLKYRNIKIVIVARVLVDLTTLYFFWMVFSRMAVK